MRDGDELLGVVPLVAEPFRAGTLRLRLLGSDTSTGAEPLVRAGSEEVVARLAASGLAARTPRAHLLSLEGIDARSPWPGLLARHWPGARPRLLERTLLVAEPTIDLTGTFDAWLAARSSHFRKRLRRVRRNLAAAGVTARRTTTQTELGPDLDAFLALHASRWHERGGSAIVTPAVERMVREAAPRLLAQGRLDIHNLEAGGRVIGSHVYLSTPERTDWWLHGYDDAWGKGDPELTLAGMAAAIEDGFARHLRHLSLGAGGQPYKQRLADGQYELATTVLPLPGAWLPLVLAGLSGQRARVAAIERLGPERKARLKAVLRR